MKTSKRSDSTQSGSVLIITVCIAFVIGLSLVSYLLLVQSQNRMVFRSQQWNFAMAHAEAGVEEALAQLNHKFGTNISRAANGWGGGGGGNYGPVNRTLSLGAYSATISDDLLPVIVSTGYATNAINGDTVERTVEVTTRPYGAFQLGMAAKLNIVFNGNNVHVDSFDSSDPSKSTFGNYDPAKAQANCDVASTDGWVDVGNANVNGRIRTGPEGSYNFGPQGWAGPIGWNGPGLYSPDWYRNDFNADFKDVDPPYETGFQVTESSIPGDTNYCYLGNMPYIVNGNFKMNGANKTILVTGDAQLYVTGDFILPSTWEIKIEPGATLKVYVGSTSGTAVKAVFGAVNTTSNTYAGSFQYYGLPTNTSVTWSGNDKYRGTIYAPQATFTLSGTGNNTVYDYQGACVVYNVVMNGHFNFHYDEALKKKDPASGYVAGSWRELRNL